MRAGLALVLLVSCGERAERLEARPLPTTLELAPSAPAPAPAASACPDGMILIAGGYCPRVRQDCLEHHPEWVRERERVARRRARGEPAATTASERCLRYREPSECVATERMPLRFCIDRYEFPNQAGAVPLVLVSWHDAASLCAEHGKRLCSEDEFNFACEGEQMLPYTYGHVRDPERCNIDRPYLRRRQKLAKHDACLADASCRAELERLDQREPSGARKSCVSPFGVFDLNGNVNEWVVRRDRQAPHRSGLKGGWWGPVRGRCRPTTGFHKEDDWGYEAGFRCCKDAR